jgi:hypothetical protein
VIGAARAAVAFGVALCLAAPGSAQQVPQAYGPGYGELVAAAYKERSLSIDSTTDEAEADGLLAGFRALYPGLEVTYAKRNSTEIVFTRMTKAQFALVVGIGRAAARSQVSEALGSGARSRVRRQPR